MLEWLSLQETHLAWILQYNLYFNLAKGAFSRVFAKVSHEGKKNLYYVSVGGWVGGIEVPFRVL